MEEINKKVEEIRSGSPEMRLRSLNALDDGGRTIWRMRPHSADFVEWGVPHGDRTVLLDFRCKPMGALGETTAHPFGAICVS